MMWQSKIKISTKKCAWRKPSRGTNEVRDEQESTEMMSCGLSAEGEGIDVCQFRRPVYRRQPRSDCERCRLTRGAATKNKNKH